MEVIYTELRQTPVIVVNAEMQEDVDVIRLSILSGAHMGIFTKIMSLLKAEDAGDILVFGGGIIPKEDIEKLENIGVKKIFTPGASTKEIVQWVNSNISV